MPASDVQIVAHRAGPLRRGVPWHAEQTLPAFADTWSRERVTCELDVRFTADGVPVVFHDTTLQRITGRDGSVHELDLPGFRALRADILGADRVLARAPAPVPLATLADVLAFARRSGARLNVELKNLPGDPAFDAGSGTAERVASVLRSIPAQQLTVQTFWAGDLEVLGARLPGVRRSLLVPEGTAEAGVATATACGATAVGFSWPACGDSIAAARAAGLYVMTYTVNDPAAIRAAARAGVDAVITDDPAAARLALAGAPLAVRG
jgi:glycerophosphoryl diester phosphodiesterase